MPVTTRQTNGVTILDVSGKVTAGEGSGQVRSAVNTALSGGATKILLNIKDTTTLDSSGIGEFMSSYASVTGKGGTLKLASPPPKVQDTLNVTKLNNVIETHDTEDEAVKSFS
jgi:anti-sigma B factor antagonist